MSGETEKDGERGKKKWKTSVTGGAGAGGWWGEVGESARSQAQEGGGPTHQTMPVLKGQNGRELEEMTQRMRHHVDGEGAGEGWGWRGPLCLPAWIQRS